MARGPSTFRQQDATRAARAALAAGLEVRRIEIGKDGKIVVVTGKPMATGESETPEELRKLI
jgi:hypothetical protein